jgi:hypothetical protein
MICFFEVVDEVVQREDLACERGLAPLQRPPSPFRAFPKASPSSGNVDQGLHEFLPREFDRRAGDVPP